MELKEERVAPWYLVCGEEEEEGMREVTTATGWAVWRRRFRRSLRTLLVAEEWLARKRRGVRLREEQAWCMFVFYRGLNIVQYNAYTEHKVRSWL